MPKVSVIIPNYNHAAYLQKRIESVLNQTYQDFEVILIDDCSTDSSREILNKFALHPKVSQVVVNKANSGSTFKQWNKGAELAKGEYMWIAESDDFADKNFLHVLVQILDTKPETGLAFSQSYVINEHSDNLGLLTENIRINNAHLPWQKDFILNSRNVLISLFVEYNFILNASAVLFRRIVFQQIGGADEKYMLAGDWLMWLKFGLYSHIYFCSLPLNYYRFHSNNVRSKTKNKQFYEFFRIMYFIYKSKYPEEEQKKRAITKMLYFRKKCMDNKNETGSYKLYKMSLIVYAIHYQRKIRALFSHLPGTI